MCDSNAGCVYKAYDIPGQQGQLAFWKKMLAQCALVLALATEKVLEKKQTMMKA